MNTDHSSGNDDLRAELTNTLLRLHEERCRREFAEREADRLKAQLSLLNDIIVRGLAAGHIRP